MKKFLVTAIFFFSLIIGIGYVCTLAEETENLGYKFEILSSNISFSQQPESRNPGQNAYDNDSSTYWASLDLSNAVIDLGGSFDISNVGVQFQKYGDDRVIPYSIYTSLDGGIWNVKHKGESLKQSNEFIYTMMGTTAQYIKFEFEGNSISGWNGVAEIEVYTTEEVTIYEQKGDFVCVNGVITKYMGSNKVVNIPSTLEGVAVKAIAYSAFKSTDITHVVIPDSVTSIGDYAFQGCGNLTSVTILGSVTNIGDYAFQGCSSLTSVTIPGSVTNIGDYAFQGCSSLTSVIIPGSVTSIGDYAFQGCSSLTSVTISDGVTSIGNSAFSSCSSLTNVTIPDSVMTLENSAFSSCGSLNSIIIPDSVVTIGDYAFSWCESLMSITIPNNVTSMGHSVFSFCKSLTSVIISDGATVVGRSPFGYCDNLTEIIVGENNEVYCSIDGVLFSKDKTTLIQYPIGRTDVMYAVGNGVTSIGDYAFYTCGNLTSITLPDGVTSIGAFAFASCKALTNMSLPQNVTSIGLSAFHYCEKLKDITIPPNVTNIEYSAFEGCKSITKITIPNSVTSIGNRTFNRCDNLTEIIVDENNEFYCSTDGVLFSKDRTILIQYPAGKSGTEYNIPNRVTSIGDYAFSYCDSFANITIPDGVTSIGANAFYRCSSLTNITIPDGVTSIGANAFYRCSSLTNIIIPNSVTTISRGAFWSCDSLANIIIPNGVATIENQTFRSCKNLESITIPIGVTKIVGQAFTGCQKLTNVYYGGNESDWEKITISDSSNNILTNATIHYTMTNYTPSIETVLEDGLLTVILQNISKDSVVSVLTITDGISQVQTVKYSGNGEVTFKLENDVDDVKVFVWKSFASMSPVVEAVLVK